MSRSPFPSLRTAGGLFTADLFTRVLEGPELPGREPEAYGLLPHETVREAAAREFEYLCGAWEAFARERERARQEGRAPRTRERWLLPLFRSLGFGVLQPSGGGFTIEGTQYPVSHRWEHVPIHLVGWGVELDRRTKGIAGAAHKAPQSMLQEMLNRSDDHLWGILSNGARLRLLRDSRALAGSAYVEFDLELIFSERLFPDFLLLYRLVHATRFAVPEGKTVADCLLERWRNDAVRIGERARSRMRLGVRRAIETLGTGFLRHPANDLLRRRLAGTATPEELAKLPMYDTPEKLALYGGSLDKLCKLSKEDFNRAILRTVYRLLFWFVAEDRDVLLEPAKVGDRLDRRVLTARERYAAYFSAQRLRERALRGGVDHHDDLWQAVQLIFTALGTEEGLPDLAIPGIGGLFERITELPDGTPLNPSLPDELDAPLEGMQIANHYLLEAVRHLTVVETGFHRRTVNFRELDTEELGSVYEGLLEYHPDVDTTERTFSLGEAPGNERKKSGSYYTPPSLTEALLDTTLDPVLDDVLRDADTDEAKVEALLNVTVCDPACGSGHFLVAAARRIARRIAQIRSGEDEPSPDLVRHAMREVVSRCIYGVDINEMSAELAKVQLWLESVEPGRPLAFLDANIRVGNSLLGATPALIKRGIPKAAYKPIEGDDKEVAAAVAKENEAERDRAANGIRQETLFGDEPIHESNVRIASHTQKLVSTLPARMSDLTVQRRRLREIDAQRKSAKRVADSWCAAFVQELTLKTRMNTIKDETLSWIGGDGFDERRQEIVARVDALSREYRFFHWHVEFPHVFRVSEQGDVNPLTGWSGGFTCVIGNPPWERVKIQEKEYFATRNEEIANAKNAAARKLAIEGLKDSEEEADRRLYAEFKAALRHADGTTLLLRDSGRYPLTGRGDINTYAVFAETGRTILASNGRVGMVLPTGIATDATTQFFFKDMVETNTLVSIYDFENEEKIFPDVHHSVRFCLWSASGRNAPQERIDLAFRLRQVTQIPERKFSLTPEDIKRINPNTGTCPVFDYKRNAEITVGIHRRVPVLWREASAGVEESNPWGLTFLAMFHMSNDSGLFYPDASVGETLTSMLEEGWELKDNVLFRDGKRLLPLYEAKMLHHFDDRFGTYEGQTQAQANVGILPRPTPEQKDDPDYVVIPRYWVSEDDVLERLCPPEGERGRRRAVRWERGWLLGWRDISNSSNMRTLISWVMPLAGIGHTGPLILPSVKDVSGLYANLCSFVLDFVVRQKMAGTHITYNYLTQLPVLPPSAYDRCCEWDPEEQIGSWVRSRVLELTYTSYGLEAFARDHGDNGPPFRWDEERRFWLRAELDAAYFHLYGVSRDDVDYIMETFRAFKNVTPALFASTKKAILKIYDTMSEAIANGTRYRTVLDPAPGHGPRHPARPAAE